jgi:hypothetical protein
MIAVVAVGCGGTPAPATAPPSNAPPPPPPASAIGDTLVDHLRAYRDDMCTCTTGRCAREVTREMRRWHDHHDELAGRPHTAEADQLEQQIHACEAKVSPPGSDEGSMVAMMKKFTAEMCSCVGTTTAGDCAKGVTDEMTKWATQEANRDVAAEKPDEEETKVIQQFTECATKAMMSGVQQPTP